MTNEIEQLKNLTIDAKVPKFSLAGRKGHAFCSKVRDEDTVHLVVILHGEPVRFVCRCLGLRTDIKARDRLKELILGKIIYVEFGAYDEYGRPLVDLWVRGSENSRKRSDDNNVRSIMIREGLGHDEKKF